MLKSGEIIDVFVDRLAVGGDGVARHDNIVVFIPFAAPNEKLRVRVFEIKKNFAKANILEILEPSPHRVPANCSVYGKCGGCNWQHISYEQQLDQKVSFARRALDSVWHQQIAISIEPSPQQWRYRNRIQVKKMGNDVGFFQRLTHDIVPISDCPISDSLLISKLDLLKKEASLDLERIEILLSTDNNVLISKDSPNAALSGFSQINSLQNSNLISFVLSMARNTNPQFVYDLYCGTGNFTFPLALELGLAIHGADLNKAGIKMAQERVLKLGLKRVTFEVKDIERLLKEKRSADPSFVLLDPPRIGCSSGVLEGILKLRPQWLLYISCSLPMLVRDLKHKSNGTSIADLYKLENAKVFDMFPQTDHLETAVFLSLK